MIDVEDADDVQTFELPGVTVYAVDDNKLAFYDPANDSAYIGAENAVDLHDWR